MCSSSCGSRALTRRRAAPLLLSGVLLACTFPNYAFQREQVSADGGAGAGGTPQASAGSSGAGGVTGAAAGSGGVAGSGEVAGSGGAGGSTLAGADAGGATSAGASAGGAAGGRGSLLFSDNFETGQASRWTANLPADWAVVTASSNQVYRQGTKGDALSVSSAGDPSWTDQALEARLKILTFGGSTTSDLALLAVRFRDSDNFYYAALRADGKVVLKARLNGTDGALGASVSASITTNTWYTVKAAASGTQLSVYIDDALIQTFSGVLIASGSIALGTNNATVEFDDVSVTAP